MAVRQHCQPVVHQPKPVIDAVATRRVRSGRRFDGSPRGFRSHIEARADRLRDDTTQGTDDEKRHFIAQRCAACLHFNAESNTCKLVEGQISPNGWCDLWTKKA
ncbi:high-potential iron-sulfur protein [Zoogloea sp.]|uniref:high-potential iron-sulfur protein n=1 Tax=Zoogloea sp. TaxID=49181 RepID=UPI002621AA14|nr:high-potential iron-sulfur protein [Zoogloea sp.]